MTGRTVTRYHPDRGPGTAGAALAGRGSDADCRDIRRLHPAGVGQTNPDQPGRANPEWNATTIDTPDRNRAGTTPMLPAVVDPAQWIPDSVGNGCQVGIENRRTRAPPPTVMPDPAAAVNGPCTSGSRRADVDFDSPSSTTTTVMTMPARSGIGPTPHRTSRPSSRRSSCRFDSGTGLRRWPAPGQGRRPDHRRVDSAEASQSPVRRVLPAEHSIPNDGQRRTHRPAGAVLHRRGTASAPRDDGEAASRQRAGAHRDARWAPTCISAQ